MKRLIMLILLLITSSQLYASQCTYPIGSLIESNLKRVQNPYFVQIEKAIIADPNLQPPVVTSFETVYTSSVSYKDFLTPERLSDLYKGNIVSEEIRSNEFSEMRHIVMYPIMNINKGYVSGVMILGYNKEIQNNYQFFTGVELLSSYLTQAIETCR